MEKRKEITIEIEIGNKDREIRTTGPILENLAFHNNFWKAKWELARC